MRVGFGAAEAVALEAAGSSLPQVIKCNVYCVPGRTHFATFDAVYERYFPDRRAITHLYVHSLLAGTVRP